MYDVHHSICVSITNLQEGAHVLRVREELAVAVELAVAEPAQARSDVISLLAADWLEARGLQEAGGEPERQPCLSDVIQVSTVAAQLLQRRRPALAWTIQQSGNKSIPRQEIKGNKFVVFSRRWNDRQSNKDPDIIP